MELFLEELKTEIRDSIRHNTHRGFIGWHDCDDICLDIEERILDCKIQLQRGEYILALKGGIFLKHTCMKLASSADSSSGSLTYTDGLVMEFMEECTSEIAILDDKTKNSALKLIISEAKNKVFDGWVSEEYEFLQKGIVLCDEKNCKALEHVADEILSRLKDNGRDIGWDKRYYDLTIYLLHRHVFGKEASKKELHSNLDNRDMRLLAIRDAEEEGNLLEAEQLCLEILKNHGPRWYQRNDPNDWNTVLLDIYEKLGDRDKLETQLKKLLFLGRYESWADLKCLYEEKGGWKEERLNLLNELEHEAEKDYTAREMYRYALQEEDEKERLMENIKDDVSGFEAYVDFLVDVYPEQIYSLYFRAIEKQCTEAKEKKHYRRVVKQINKLIELGGEDTARDLVSLFREKYARRPSLMRELDLLDVESEVFD